MPSDKPCLPYHCILAGEASAIITAPWGAIGAGVVTLSSSELSLYEVARAGSTALFGLACFKIISVVVVVITTTMVLMMRKNNLSQLMMS